MWLARSNSAVRHERKSSLVIHVYTVCYNEEFMLPYFFRHYKRFASQILVCDNESTDRSREISLREGAKIVILKTGGRYYEMALTRFRNSAYKNSRGVADWVIVVDIDEFLWHEDVIGILERYKAQRVTVPRVIGYEMVSDGPPRLNGQIYDELKVGHESRVYSKRVVFNPQVDINFLPGSHSCCSTGVVIHSKKAEFKLLHYRFLGADYLRRRWLDIEARHSDENMHFGYSRHPTDIDSIKSAINLAKEKAHKVL
jgi:glycosyltransferase involved in cell wall biosynthesis